MFRSIFSFELNQWFNKPLFYIYALALAGFGALMMGATAGIFEGNTSTVSGLTYVNSPLQLTYFLGSFTSIAFFLLPSIIGTTIHKDFKSNMYHLLYSFPFSKRDYILSKFLVGFVIAFILLIFLGLGVYVGTTLPGVDKNLIAPFNGKAYLNVYLYFILPNLLLFGSIVFAVTLYTRSIIAGFIAVAVLFFGQGMADAFLANLEYDKLGAYLDPFGFNSVNYYAKYWTITEQNELMPPLDGMVLQNRIIWTLVGLAIFAFSYIRFSFSYEPISLKFWKKKGQAQSLAKPQTIIQDVDIPKVKYSYGFLQTLKSAWALSKIELKYILKGGPFIVVSIIGVLFIIVLVAVSAQIYQTDILPVTRQLLQIPGGTFSLFITLLTFIYTGLLIHRPETVRVFQLEDTTAVKTLGFLLSKFMTVVIMQMILLAIIMITGIGIQIYKGFYNFEFDLYLFDLYGVRLVNYIVWTLLAFFFFTLLPNFYLALFVLLTISIGSNFLGLAGVEQDIYKYNDGPGASYSDISKYGVSLSRYYIYKFYWIGLGLVLTTLAYLFWRRGMRERLFDGFRYFKRRINPLVIGSLLIGLAMFFGFGSWIYYETNVKDDYISSKEREGLTAEQEKIYKRFQNYPQPRITDVFLEVDLLTEKRNIEGEGRFTLRNKTGLPIDTLMVDHTRLSKNISLSMPNSVQKDTIHNIQLFALDQSMMPGDSMILTFQIKNRPNTVFRRYSPVRKNGTFFTNSNFPSIGYNDFIELTDDKTRRRYALDPKERFAPPTDSVARMNTYISNDADWINFEAIVSTAPDQIAMTPGRLQREWEEDGRKYFHYKMGSKMVNFYNVISAKYELYEEDWNGIPITIYYHKGHDYNLKRMMDGAKAALAYCSEEFSPYQHDQLRILEFPVTGGSYAQSFANTVPFSEGVGFIADVDESKKNICQF